MKTPYPKAVLISDIHFNINNLELATKALMAAIDYSNKAKIPLIIAGDLHDTKAIIRAEVANRLIEVIRSAKQEVLFLVGNHDLINEKGEENGLTYLSFAVETGGVVKVPCEYLGLALLPYQNDSQKVVDFVKTLKPGTTLIMHQGVRGAYMGDYVQDKTSVDPKVFEHLTVYSGHYHRHQKVGTVTYLGSPFTHTYGEANDGPKGFLVLYEDGSYHQEVLDYRKHLVFNISYQKLHTLPKDTKPDDLVWVKISGPKSILSGITKERVGQFLGRDNFKLDLIPDDIVRISNDSSKPESSNTELLDSIINDSTETPERKERLKKLWRDLV